jgi:hypothetical protein
MKKRLAMLVALLLVIAIAVPAFAAVEFKYGGQFRARAIFQDNLLDGDDRRNDNNNLLDYRMRMYFTFVASENLRVVTRFEVGDTTWGRGGSAVAGNRVGAGGGGNVGADTVNLETKNIYVEFGIPTTPVKALVGTQGINLLNSWIIDDDFAAAVLKAKMEPVTVQMGYVAGQVNTAVSWQDRIDSWFGTVDYKGGPLAGSLIGYYQFGHNTVVSVDPTIMSTPFGTIPGGTNNLGGGNVARPLIGVTPQSIIDANAIVPPVRGASGVSISGAKFLADNFGFLPGQVGHIEDNNLFDLGFNLEYKMSWMAAYFNFVKNLGGVDVVNDTLRRAFTADYEGFMLDAGANIFCGPYTFNIGGFYTTGDERQLNATRTAVQFKNRDEIGRFVYPSATQKYFSEIMGGGILDNVANIAHTDAAGRKDYQWEGYGWPSNIWTVTVGGAWQALEQTKLSASYWYFGTSEDVSRLLNRTPGLRRFELVNDIGHELDFYVTQGIVDGLTLDVVGALLITGDAYTAAVDREDNVYEVGARLQWSF